MEHLTESRFAKQNPSQSHTASFSKRLSGGAGPGGPSNPGWAACLCTNELYYINKALTKFSEASTKPYHGLIHVLPWIDLRYQSKWLYTKKDIEISICLKHLFILYLIDLFTP